VTTTILWLRRDLRLSDHPALLAAGADGARVLPLFVIDPALWGPSGAPRRVMLVRSLRALDAAMDGHLLVRYGDPVRIVPQVAAQARADAVHVSADAGPYGRARDESVALALRKARRALVRTGTPYAIGPGTLLNGSGAPYQVFTPFRTAWLRHGWPAPAPALPDPLWAVGVDGEPLPEEPEPAGLTLPAAGEEAALQRWAQFRDEALAGYVTGRDLPGLDATSGLSAHLKYGEIHPRTLLADLARHEGGGAETFRSELCWREFYADVLWHHPRSARQYLRAEYARMHHDDPAVPGIARERLAAWQEGRTGYPFVDAGMRQLRAEGWMHNRVRMVTASFLVKHLHLEWQHGARHFMHWLRDGDLASNSHGWQWTAGSGTDAAPYFRIFNPVTQGLRFDPDGTYLRRYLPELGHLSGSAAHQPWDAADGYAHGYPPRLVDLGAERAEALDRLAAVRAGTAAETAPR
jgi:deoxyribodipyrimidine photo-lyase